ncbi:cell adhesion molecule CEACAM8-like isoform X2 [Lissotriton helveticus]
MGVPCAPRPRWPHSPKALILTAWLGIWVQQTVGKEPMVQKVTAIAGDTATLITTEPKDIFSVNWFKGTESNKTQQIIVYLASTGKQTPGPKHTGRESVLPNGSLRITDLRTSDTGNYVVVTALMNGVQMTDPPSLLTVQEKARSPPISPSSSPGLSVGYIVRIAIGVLAVFIIVAATAGDSPEMAPNNKFSAIPKANRM